MRLDFAVIILHWGTSLRQKQSTTVSLVLLIQHGCALDVSVLNAWFYCLLACLPDGQTTVLCCSIEGGMSNTGSTLFSGCFSFNVSGGHVKYFKRESVNGKMYY